MKARSTILIKENGNVRFVGQTLDVLTSLLPNGHYVLSVKKEEKQRSISQNALMWMWFACIAEATGNTKEEVHDAYCYMFLSRPVTFGDRCATIPSGTKALKSDEMRTFLDQVQADAASELGITLPNPDDMYFADFCEQYKGKI